MIEYTLEFLANAGVQEVFLYGGAHSDKLEKYIKYVKNLVLVSVTRGSHILIPVSDSASSASKWKAPSSPFKKLSFLKSTSTSVGDVMRDLDGKHVITGDFIVVSGDVISNLPIEGALAKHRARRQADKNAIMTMVLREAGRNHRTKSSGVSPVFVIDPTKDRCLHYEEINPHDRSSSSRLTIDAELLASHPEIDIRHDLIDCSIDICTPDVLSLWSDSFDYQAPRKHFLYGVLKDYELNGKTIHTHIIKDHYAARVRNLKAYDAVSKDIISRWTYPLCPDTNLLPGHCYELRRGNLYQERGVILARSCIIGRRNVIGQGTSIGDKTTVTNSVLGRDCKIGKNVVLDGAYLWDGVVIGDGTEIRQAILADGVVVGNQCKIEPGALLSFGVKIASGVTVRPGTRITVSPREAGTPVANDEKVVGEGGQGYEFVREEDEDEDDTTSIAESGLGTYIYHNMRSRYAIGQILIPTVYQMARLNLSSESISTLSSEISSETLETGRSRTDSFGTSHSDGEHDRFEHDASTSIYDSMREGVSSDVVQLELVSLRMSANASDHQVRRAIASAFVKRIQHLMESGKSAGEAVKEVFGRYREVIDRSLFDKDKDDKEDQVDLLLQIQQNLVHRNKGETILLFTAKELYDLELVEEEAYEQWWADARSSNTEEMKKIRSQTEQFVDWLANAEEEDSDEEEEEEESDEE